MGECCALLICKLHLVLKAQQFPWPLSPRSCSGRRFLGKAGRGGGIFLQNNISQAPLSYFKMLNSSQKYHRTACVPSTIAVTETNMN